MIITVLQWVFAILATGSFVFCVILFIARIFKRSKPLKDDTEDFYHNP